MKILLLGASGQIGFELLRVLGSRGELIPQARSAFAPWPRMLCVDLSDLDTALGRIAEAAPDLIVNAAAWTAVDAAESETAAAAVLNHHLPARLAAYCAERGVTLVHLSTDYVFDGQQRTPYREDDPPAPLSAYGRSKRAGEVAIEASGAPALIVRTSWVYSARRGNFVRTILGRAAAGRPLKVVDDQIGRLTWARDIADGIGRLMHCRPRPAGAEYYHLAGADIGSWYDVAVRIVTAAVEVGLLASPVEVVPIASRDWPQAAPRPAYAVLDCERLAKIADYRAGGWCSLYLCLKEMSDAGWRTAG